MEGFLYLTAGCSSGVVSLTYAVSTQPAFVGEDFLYFFRYLKMFGEFFGLLVIHCHHSSPARRLSNEKIASGCFRGSLEGTQSYPSFSWMIRYAIIKRSCHKATSRKGWHKSLEHCPLLKNPSFWVFPKK